MSFDSFWPDFKLAIRSLSRYPIACAVAVVSLAAGIGSTTAVLTIRNALFRNPPPLYAEPGQLAMVRVTTPEGARRGVPAELYRSWTTDQGVRAGLAAAAPTRVSDVRGDDQAASVGVRAVTPELFPLLGVAPAMGRGFDTVAGDSGSPVILSHCAWQTVYGGRSDVVGRTIWIDDAPHVIAGVMPERFWFESMNTPIWRPLDIRTLDAADLVTVVARAPAGASRTAVLAQLERGASQYAGRLPADRRHISVHLSGVGGTPLGRSIAPYVVWLLGASVLLTLLIACTNVAILMMAQWTGREREIAIRAAIGASRARVIRSLLVESLALALAGGTLGIGATFALLGLIRRAVWDATLYDLSVDPAVFAQAAFVSCAAGVLTGLAPALYETRRLQANPLRQMGASDRVRQRWRHALVVFEIATTVALLVVTTAMVSAYSRMLAFEPGFDLHALAGATIERQRGVAVDRVLERLAGLPGVERVAATSSIPLGSVPGGPVSVDAAESRTVSASRTAISPGFFATLGVPIRGGRDFTAADGPNGAPVAIVNVALARRLWSGFDAIGRELFVGGRPHQIVGVVADFQPDPLARPSPMYFVSVGQARAVWTRIEFVVRTAGDPPSAVPAIRDAIREVDPGATSSAYALKRMVDVGSQEMLVGAFPMVPLIATGILLTAAGIYGVLAFAIARRSIELAVRAAVGASGFDLMGLVLGHSLRLLATGILSGVAVTFALTRVAQGSGGIFDTPGAATFAIPVALVLTVGLLATWIPARRAMRVNPAVLLRGN